MVVLGTANAAEDVDVIHQCEDDPVGMQVAYHVRQEVSRSATLALVDDALIALRIVCIQPGPDDAGVVSFFSYAVTFRASRLPGHFLLDNGVMRVGQNRAADQAGALVAKLDDAARTLRAQAAAGRLDWLKKD
ncbi:MAG: hypothetical protein LKM39_12685 [Chiayiivirga sp.]|jgi:hypothetical protein|nr:hypothetical protein [Chiayiivirga sp.]